MLKAVVMWSIFVRCASINKLKQDHLPLILDALGDCPFGVETFRDETEQGLFRIYTYQALQSDDPARIVTTVLARAYSLRDGWTLHGLRGIGGATVPHVIGGWQMTKMTSRPPAVVSMMFEIEPGDLKGRSEDGGWFIDRPGA